MRELVQGGHDVVALVRSETAASAVAQFGAIPIPGDITKPESWLSGLPALDGVIHAAATFDEEEEATERRLLESLLPLLSAAPRKTRFIYTGGCWLFGTNNGVVTTEDSPFDPPRAFAWSVKHIRLVLDIPNIHAIVIHPAMVYEPCGGAFDRFLVDAQERHAVRVVESEDVIGRWCIRRISLFYIVWRWNEADLAKALLVRRLRGCLSAALHGHTRGDLVRVIPSLR